MRNTERFFNLYIWALLAAIIVLPPVAALAELTISIQPGYQFSTGERPTVAALNQLGTPTAQVTGTLGGTNVALAANTVTGTMLGDTVPGSNLLYDASSPRRIVIANSGVGINQIGTGIAGIGLTGGGGVALTVTNIPLSRLTITTNTLVGGGPTNVIAVGPGLILTAGTLSVSNFSSLEYSLAAGLVANTNHGLGSAPAMMRWVLVCKTADISFVAGDEIPVQHFYDGSNERLIFSSGASATNVFCSLVSTTGISTRRKDDGTHDTITASRWRAKCYAKP